MGCAAAVPIPDIGPHEKCRHLAIFNLNLQIQPDVLRPEHASKSSRIGRMQFITTKAKSVSSPVSTSITYYLSAEEVRTSNDGQPSRFQQGRSQGIAHRVCARSLGARPLSLRWRYVGFSTCYFELVRIRESRIFFVREKNSSYFVLILFSPLPQASAPTLSSTIAASSSS